MTDRRPQVSFGDKFLSSLNALAPADARRVTLAVERLTKDPDYPLLRLKMLQGDRSRRLHSIRAAYDIRVIIAREGAAFLVLEAGLRRLRAALGFAARTRLRRRQSVEAQ